MAAVLVAPEVEAAAVGQRVLQDGGSAVDAAVASAFAQAVVNPLLCGLGGSALVLYADLKSREVTVINGEAATGSRPVPAAWGQEFLGRAETFGRYAIESEENQVGPASVMVPGFVDAMETLLNAFGSTRLNRSDILLGASELARIGFVVSPYAQQYWDANSAGDSNSERPGYPSLIDKMMRQPLTAKNYLKKDYSGYRAGDVFSQPWVADILDQLSVAGFSDFLHGEIGGIIGAGLEADNSLVDSNDVSSYRTIITPSVAHQLGDFALHSTPPPSPGIQVIQMLSIARHLGLNGVDLDASTMDFLAKTMRASFADNQYIKATRPQEVDNIIESVLSEQAIGRWVSAIRSGDGVIVSGNVPGDGTTHVTAVDESSAVCITHSLGSVAGSAYVIPELGFVFNNFLGHYDPRPGSRDSIRPGARIGTGAPLIAFDKSEFRVALGAPGGSRLITSDFQVARSVLFAGDDADEAVARPRLHSEEGKIVFVEATTSSETASQLRDNGNDVRESSYMSRVQAVSQDRDGVLHGGSDPRGGVGIARRE